MKHSAGLLLYKIVQEKILFFLVHPGGPFFSKKDSGWWTIPKGEVISGENPFQAAKREFQEETGTEIQGDFTALSPITQKGGKRVECWAVAGDIDIGKAASNTFDMDWPPRSGKIKTFPEIDRYGWFDYEEAIQMINEKQRAFLVELRKLLKDR